MLENIETRYDSKSFTSSISKLVDLVLVDYSNKNWISPFRITALLQLKNNWNLTKAQVVTAFNLFYFSDCDRSYSPLQFCCSEHRWDWVKFLWSGRVPYRWKRGTGRCLTMYLARVTSTKERKAICCKGYCITLNFFLNRLNSETFLMLIFFKIHKMK